MIAITIFEAVMVVLIEIISNIISLNNQLHPLITVVNKITVTELMGIRMAAMSGESVSCTANHKLNVLCG